MKQEVWLVLAHYNGGRSSDLVGAYDRQTVAAQVHTELVAAHGVLEKHNVGGSGRLQSFEICRAFVKSQTDVEALEA